MDECSQAQQRSPDGGISHSLENGAGNNDEISPKRIGNERKSTPHQANCDVLDIVRHTGDGTGTFNISTTAGFRIAAGVPRCTATVQCQAKAVRQYCLEPVDSDVRSALSNS